MVIPQAKLCITDSYSSHAWEVYYACKDMSYIIYVETKIFH